MKTTKLIFSAWACFAFAVSSSNAAALKEQKIPMYKANLEYQQAYFKMDYGQPFVLDLQDIQHLYKKAIVSVDIVCTDDPKGIDLTQLNHQRIEKIKQLSPTLFSNPSIKWNIVRQTNCKDKSDAQNYFHGAVVNYTNSSILYENLESQKFTVNTTKDETIACKNGTKIQIPANSFTDHLGNPVQGNVTVEVVEAIRPTDIILGNLSTYSNGKILETGGMVYVDALQNNTHLQLKKDKHLNIAVPSANPKSDMQIFEGVENKTKVEWMNPVPLHSLNANAAPINMTTIDFKINSRSGPKTDDETIDTKMTWMMNSDSYCYTVSTLDQIDSKTDLYPKIIQLISINSETLNKDTVVIIEGHKIQINVQDISVYRQNNEINQRNSGINMSLADPSTSYIFESKKLGWANIDRFTNDTRAANVNMITNVINESDFNYVYTTLIVNGSNTFISGYQKKDGSFCFSHGDTEPQRLPVGANAKIFAVAYKDKTPYYQLYDFVISADKTIDLSLQKTTKEELKKALEIGI